MVMMVVIDEPEGREFGGSVAAPIFKNIARKALPLLGVFLEKEDIVEEEVAETTPPEADVTEAFVTDSKLNDVSPLDMIKVPDFRNLNVSDAILKASKAGLDPFVEGNADTKVIRQYPEPGEVVSFGTVLELEAERPKEE